MASFESKVKNYGRRLMVDLDITDFQAAGIFGNLGAETGGFKLLQEVKPLVKGSRGGFGWMQWTGPRRRAFEAWAKKGGHDITADETNYMYIIHETLTAERASLIALRKTKTVDEATVCFMKKNLRPGIPHVESRKRWGQKALAALQATPVKDAGAVAGPIVAGGAAAWKMPEYLPYIIGGVVLAIAVGLFIRWRMKKRNIK